MNKKAFQSEQEAVSAENFPLAQLYFYLTEGCNLACKHCWLAPRFDPGGSRQAILPLELFQQAVEDALPLGLSRVKLTGGEPLLHKDFLAILATIKRHRVGLTIESNGILLTSAIAEAIAEHETPHVSISLDGADTETHDRIRGFAGAFVKATDAIRTLAAKGVYPQVIMSIMQENAGQVEAVIALAESLGAGSVKFNIIQPTGRGKTIRDACDGLDISDLIALGKKVELELSPQTDLTLYFDYPAAFRSLRSLACGDSCGVCGILNILGVLPGGEYALCGIGSHVPDLVFGRVGSGTLADMWNNHTILKDLRSGLPGKLTGICSHCLMKHICLGSCIAQNYYSSGSLWTPFWFCAKAEAAGLFPDSRLDFSLEKGSTML